MAQSPSLRYYGYSDKAPLTPTLQDTESVTNQPDNVQGWLMNLHPYRDPSDKNSIIVDADNNSIPIETGRRKGRPGSIASEDSVNLDELINANFTGDMDDETDLPDLAALDLDDSAEDFWKMDSLSGGNLDYDLDWNPAETMIPPTAAAVAHTAAAPVATTVRRPLLQDKKRSDSFSSENSLNSQSTITQYAKYGLTPMMIHPSESSSSSSRSLSRLSNYSATSSTTPTTTGGIPTPSRSYTTRNTKSPPRSTKRITKRASHIPAPASTSHTTSPPTPQRTLSSSSSSSGTPMRIPTLSKPTNSTSKRIPQQRASHIPTVRESIHRPGSPLNSGRNSATPSRIGMRSPTPGPRNSLFHHEPTTEQKRVMSPTANRPSGLRPPTATSSPSSIRPPSNTTSARSVSRIGTVKKS
ncbi:uncharacterized protein EV154DRAFT_491884 [Mucor mucedo]|uniref:uncharacterized protein n=1 Tax=Mucor mucedo TaxID=29922 RepID=UPI00222113CA|nr:uncharacterized protein EV154DRAFT_491884 [Mucor mucedo]KAI7896697.1 hypothetical protein EV154DRAFT_491884 [Mucor mucedo]